MGIEVEDGLFHGGGFRQLGVQCVEILAIIAWSIATVSPFFYLVGVALGRDLRNPRASIFILSTSHLFLFHTLTFLLCFRLE